jgi:DNA-binding transcriptional MerR regulator
MKEDRKYTIGELAEKAGVSRRAVRFYVQNRIIPPPVGLGRHSYYTDEHLERILVKRSSSVRLQSDSQYDTISGVTEIQSCTRILFKGGFVLEIPAAQKLPDREQLEKINEILNQREDNREDKNEE